MASSSTTRWTQDALLAVALDKNLPDKPQPLSPTQQLTGELKDMGRKVALKVKGLFNTVEEKKVVTIDDMLAVSCDKPYAVSAEWYYPQKSPAVKT